MHDFAFGPSSWANVFRKKQLDVFCLDVTFFDSLRFKHAVQTSSVESFPRRAYTRRNLAGSKDRLLLGANHRAPRALRVPSSPFALGSRQRCDHRVPRPRCTYPNTTAQPGATVRSGATFKTTNARTSADKPSIASVASIHTITTFEASKFDGPVASSRFTVRATIITTEHEEDERTSEKPENIGDHARLHHDKQRRHVPSLLSSRRSAPRSPVNPPPNHGKTPQTLGKTARFQGQNVNVA